VLSARRRALADRTPPLLGAAKTGGKSGPKAVNIADRTKFLDNRGALNVVGPRPGGMYRVRIARTRLAADELARAVKEFQSASNLVSFAAPTE
jgi:hypothetical protein